MKAHRKARAVRINGECRNCFQREGIESRCKETPSRRTPAAIKAEIQRLRHREAQLAAFRREGIYVEEEYREEICRYMHEMEVSSCIKLVPSWLYECPSSANL